MRYLGRVEGLDDLTVHASAYGGLAMCAGAANRRSLRVLGARVGVGVCVWQATSKARIWRRGGLVDGIIETRETSTLTSNRQADQQ